MDVLLGLIGLVLMALLGLSFAGFIIGLIKPAAALPDDHPSTRAHAAKIYGAAVALSLGLVIAMGTMIGDSGEEGQAEATAQGEAAAGLDDAAAEGAIRDALGWGSTTEAVTEAGTLTLRGGDKLAEVRVQVGQSLDQADAVRTWGTAIKEVATGAGTEAVQHYDRFLFYIEAPIRNGDHALVAKVKAPAGALLRLREGPEASHAQYIDQVSSLELRPSGKRSANAWCRENAGATPNFCQLARQ